jgi:hypothetical protein
MGDDDPNPDFDIELPEVVVTPVDSGLLLVAAGLILYFLLNSNKNRKNGRHDKKRHKLAAGSLN